METVLDKYTWKDRLEEYTARPYRFALWIVFFGLAFGIGRFWFFAAVTVFAIARGIRMKDAGESRIAWGAALVAVVFASLLFIADRQTRAINSFAQANTPILFSTIPNGSHVGVGQGNNGDIEARVWIANGRIEDLELLSYREPVYAFDDLLKNVKGAPTSDFSDLPGFVFRNRESVGALEQAVVNAVLPTLAGYPKRTKTAKAALFFASNKIGRIMINALAILFIAIITFEYFLQPALAKGTGQSLNCYNCQACVGVCPVKMVAGDPFPMIMVIEARAGNYDRVAELAKFCVGCGKCAAKCPVGNSGPSVASSSYLLWKQEIARAKRKEMARLRQWPTLDSLSERMESDDDR